MIPHGLSIQDFYCHKLDIYGIAEEDLSHNQDMENSQKSVMDNLDLLARQKTAENSIDLQTRLQKENDALTISSREALEYCAYKKQKKVSSIMEGISRAVCILDEKEDVHRAMAQALRLRVSALRVTPLQLEKNSAKFAERGVSADCIIGGNGETLSKVKACEAKLALRLKARQLTVKLAPSYVNACRYAEMRREIRRIRRLAKKSILKVSVCGGSTANLSRLARICSEVGVDYFSIPYFQGCERIKTELSGGVKLEVVGVETLANYKKLVSAGVGRIVTGHIAEFYEEWIKEADEITLESLSVRDTEKEN
ncbi:MAG: hypothetical protein IJY05_02175 [Clostridia bacterium]|nr:hypothetical protein [Clostridia bacterium]